MKKVILVAGSAMAGKDSTGILLKQKLSGTSIILHNADYLKYIAKEYLGWNGKKDTEGRNLLQSFGTDKVRIELKKPLFWVEKTCDIIDILSDNYEYFIVCDVRFSDEIYLPKARFPKKVVTIKVERVDFDNGLAEEQKKHPSETSLDDFSFDYIIQSKSGLNNLEKEVNKIISLIQE